MRRWWRRQLIQLDCWSEHNIQWHKIPLSFHISPTVICIRDVIISKEIFHFSIDNDYVTFVFNLNNSRHKIGRHWNSKLVENSICCISRFVRIIISLGKKDKQKMERVKMLSGPGYSSWNLTSFLSRLFCQHLVLPTQSFFAHNNKIKCCSAAHIGFFPSHRIKCNSLPSVWNMCRVVNSFCVRLFLELARHGNSFPSILNTRINLLSLLQSGSPKWMPTKQMKQTTTDWTQWTTYYIRILQTIEIDSWYG